MDDSTSVSTILGYVALGAIALFVVISALSSFFIIPQGTIGVITRFGKYKTTAAAGLNWKFPLIDKVYDKVSIQNRSEELKFQAITQDQANVHFSAMLLYSVQNSDPETIHKVAFKFSDQREFSNTLVRTIEGAVRSLIGGKKQGEILTLRKEIVDYAREHIGPTLEEWGYHLIDLQINDIAFDQAITDSMARVVASANLKAAAENEGAAYPADQEG
jgi:regulator of protease activity HflC (stomatin/prohibitin superfamily)